MKGLLAERFPSDEGEYTDVQVLKSPAGWYVGTMFVHNGRSDTPGSIEPGSRESGYYYTWADATQAFENESWEQRDNP